MTQEEKDIKYPTIYDKEARAAYIHLTENKDEKAVATIPVKDSSVALDFNEDNELIGIEILNPEQLPPKVRDMIDLK